MTSLNHLRQTFARDWDLPRQPEKQAWLIQGDFDHFKLKNDLYGPLIADYLLDWTLEVIEAQLKLHQRLWGCGDVLCSVMGDDLTIYLPPVPLAPAEISRMLWKIRDAIQKSFWRRYRVGAVPLPSDLFEDIPAASLEWIRNEFEGMDVVFDFAGRQRGFLLLFPVGAEGQDQPVIEEVLSIIQRRTGKPIPAVELHADWIFDPDGQSYSTYNRAFIDPPLVSFAACSTRIVMAGPSARAAGVSVYEQVSGLCHSTLKICKQQRKGVWIHPEGAVFQNMPVDPVAVPVRDPSSRLRWSSERFLREKLYFRQLDRPVLFQFNPVYRLPAMLSPGVLEIEKYRGNSFGIGLKGINEMCGQNTADWIIRLLIALFSDVLGSALAGKGIPPQQVWAAQFVDRLTVCCELPVFRLSEIAELVCSLATQFNAASPEIKISHLRMSIVLAQNVAVGYRLFNQLALTGLLSQSAALRHSEPRIEVRQYNDLVLREGWMALERASFSSAKRLAAQ